MRRIFAILAVSLNLEFGYTGLSNFGKVAFFAIGAYTAALSNPFLPFSLNIILGVIIAGIAGFLISIPSLKLRGDYLTYCNNCIWGNFKAKYSTTKNGLVGRQDGLIYSILTLKTMLIIVLIAFLWGCYIFRKTR